MESGNEAAFLIGASVVFVTGHCCLDGGNGRFLLCFGRCWGLRMALVEVFDELWGKEVSFGDPLVV